MKVRALAACAALAMGFAACSDDDDTPGGTELGGDLGGDLGGATVPAAGDTSGG